MRRTGKALAVLLTLTGVLALVGASAAGPLPAKPGIQNPSNPVPLPKAPILRVVPVDAGAPAPTSALVVLTAAQKAAVVTQLNDLRASIGAASMQTLAWDDNLARFAGTVAGPATVGTPCVFAHSSSASRMNVPGWVGTYVGETIAAGTTLKNCSIPPRHLLRRMFHRWMTNPKSVKAKRCGSVSRFIEATRLALPAMISSIRWDLV